MKTLLFSLTAMLPLLSFSQDTPITPFDEVLTNYSYPYPVKMMDLNIQNQQLKMAYMDVVPPNYNQQNVILFHGKNFTGASWRETIKALSSMGYRVIVPDQIGFGKSSKPAYFQYSFQQLAQNTKAILESLKIEHTIVVGHSMGGMLGVRFTLMYPKTVDKLILVDPIGLEDYKLYVPYQSIDKWYQMELKQNYTTQKAYEQASYYHGTWKPAYDEWVRVSAGMTLGANYKIVAWNSALLYDMIYTQPVLYELNRIKPPTLLIVGMLDRTFLGKSLITDSSLLPNIGRYDRLGKSTQPLIPNCQLVEIENTGHAPQIESFEPFIKAVTNFIK